MIKYRMYDGFVIVLLFTKRYNFRLLQIERVCKLNMNVNLNFNLNKGSKHCGKKRKCWLPAFSSFPRIF